MKIADIHSFFVRRVTSGDKVSKAAHVVEASKDSLDDSPRQKEDKKREENEDAAVFDRPSDEENLHPEGSEEDALTSAKNKLNGHLDLTV